MRSLKLLKLSLLAITINSCGPTAPVVTYCGIAGNALACNRAGKASTETAAQAQALASVGESPPDLLNSKNYIIDLETHLVQCNQEKIVQPFVSDCAIYAPGMMIICSDGKSAASYDWTHAQGYTFVSGADFEILKAYKTKLITEIAACK